MLALAKKLFGSSNERKVKAMGGRVAAINALEPQISALSDDALRGKTAEFKARLEKGETLDDILNEAFAVVREASKRTTGLRSAVRMTSSMANSGRPATAPPKRVSATPGNGCVVGEVDTGR